MNFGSFVFSVVGFLVEVNLGQFLDWVLGVIIWIILTFIESEMLMVITISYTISNFNIDT